MHFRSVPTIQFKNFYIMLIIDYLLVTYMVGCLPRWLAGLSDSLTDRLTD